jgi:hypothetical protein
MAKKGVSGGIPPDYLATRAKEEVDPMRALLPAVLILALATPAWATESRVECLGGVGDFLIDEVNVDIYPHLAVYYGNLVTGELGAYQATPADSGRAIALSLGSGEEPNTGVFRVAFRRTLDAPPPVVDMLRDCDLRDLPGPVLQLSYAKAFEFTSLGWQLEWAWDAEKYDNHASGYEHSYGLLGGTMGAGFKLAEEDVLDMAFSVRRYFCSYESSTREIKDSRNFSFGGRIRLFHPLSEKTTVVPVLAIDRVGAGREFLTNTRDEINHSFTTWLLGIGFLLPLYEDVTVVLGGLASLERERRKEIRDTPEPEAEDTDRIVFPQVVAGVETELRHWLIARLGGRWTTVHHSYEESPDGLEIRGHESEFQLDLGLGISLGDLVIDGRLSNDFLFTGSYLLSGTQENPFGSLSFTYSFDIF